MPDLDRRPAYRLTHAQAAGLLGVSTARVAELVGEGRLTPVAKYAKAGLLRADVERRGGSRATRHGSLQQRPPRCSG